MTTRLKIVEISFVKSCCLICSRHHKVIPCVNNIYNTTLPESGELLANFIRKVIGSSINDFVDTFVCIECFDLIKILEHAQTIAHNTQLKILQIYLSNKKENINNNNLYNKTENNQTKVLKNQVYNNKNEINSNNQNETFVYQDNQCDKIIFTPNDEKSYTHQDDEKEKDNEAVPFKKLDKIIESNEIKQKDLSSVDNQQLTTIVKVEKPNIKKNVQCVCEYCGQTFKRKRAFKIHIEMHNGNSQFQCQFCNKYFAYKASLTRHESLHTGETPYLCNVCNKKFSHSSSLKRHKFTHTGIKPFKCSICSKCIGSKYHLNRHMKTHTGEKPFRCELCDRSFAEKYNLTSHQYTHQTPVVKTKNLNT